MTAVRTDPGGPGTEHASTWKLLVSGGCLALAVTGCLTYVLHDRPSSRPSAATAAAQPARPASTLMAEPPSDITWELVSGVTVPVSPTVGPTKADGPVRYGFAHTPIGAVLAAVNIADRAAFTPGDGWLKVTQRQVKPGTGRDAFIHARRELRDLTPPDGGLGQVAGYRLIDYTASTAVVEVGETFASGVKQTYNLTVEWLGGDWQLSLASDGNPGPQPVAVENLTGLVPLSAELFP